MSPRLQNLMKVLVEALHAVTKDEEPEDAAQFLAATIGNIVGPLPEDYFAAMEEDAKLPCDRKGCECHVWTAKLFEGLRMARNDYRTTMAIQKTAPQRKFS